MARQGKNAKTGKDVTIQLSKRAFFYFFGYHFWEAFKKYVLWMLVITVAITAVNLIRSAQIFGMPDSEIATAFLAPLPRVAAGFLAVVMIYALIRAIVSTLTTKYAFTPKGVVIQSGWPTRRTTIVDYAHIQKMTIVSNLFDRMLNATYVQLDLIGGAPGVLLEAVDAQAVKNIQEKLSIPNNALLSAVTPTAPLTLTEKKAKPVRKSHTKRAIQKRPNAKRPSKPKAKKTPSTKAASARKKSPKTKTVNKKSSTNNIAKSLFNARSYIAKNYKSRTSNREPSPKHVKV
jgi:membrane protein YdbS with pleckstrin-like domain